MKACWLFLALFVSGLPGQGEVRVRGGGGVPRDRVGEVPTLGRTRTLAGRPWKRAEILFFGRRHGARVGDLEVLRARADDRGRFRVFLRKGRRYAAFAWEESKDGFYRTSALREDLTAGGICVLRDLGRRFRKRRVRVPDRKDYEVPFRLRVEFGVRIVCELPIPLDAEGGGVIPPIPSGIGRLRLREAGGKLCASREIDCAWPRRPAGQRAVIAALPAETVMLDPGFKFPVLLEVSTGKGPITGARLAIYDPSSPPIGPLVFRELGAAGKDGLRKAWIPAGWWEDPSLGRVQARILAWAPGRAIRGRARSIPVFEVERRTETPDMRLFLRDGRECSGRLLRRDGEPLRGALVLAWAPLEISTSLSLLSEGPLFETRSGEDGGFVLPPLAKGVERILGCLLPEEESAPQVLLEVGTGRKEDRPDYRLDRSVRLELGIFEDSGAPARGAEVLLLPSKRGKSPLLRSGPRFLGDRRGRLVLRVLPPFEGLFFALGRNGGVGSVRISIPGGTSGALTKSISLGPGERVRGRVTDGQGTPIPGAEVWYWIPSMKKNEDRRFLMQLLGTIRRRKSTDGNGEFEIPVSKEATLQVTPLVRFRGRMFRARTLALAPGEGRADEVLEFEIALPEGWREEGGGRR